MNVNKHRNYIFKNNKGILANHGYIFLADSPLSHNPNNAKDRFSLKFPHLNLDYYSGLSKRILARLYPKTCPVCKSQLTEDVKGRENAIRCPRCHFQGSRTAYTPLHHLKLPLWVFGYILVESIQLYPAVLSGAAIQRRLGCSNNTAVLLKRRLQLFLSDLIPAIKKIMADEISKEFKGFRFPARPDVDLGGLVEGKPIVHCDTVALFSATQRSNGGRKRFKHTGQTASIYLSDAVAEEKGKYQIGTLAHTIAIKGGAVILDSIPDQKQRTVKPLLDFLPKATPIFTDEGYPWLKRYNPNARAVNHSARAKDRKRNVWARSRWSRCGVNNQAAEGFQRILKHSFISGYTYIDPKYSTLYLNEYSVLKSLKTYTLDRLLDQTSDMWGMCTGYVRDSRTEHKKSHLEGGFFSSPGAWRLIRPWLPGTPKTSASPTP